MSQFLLTGVEKEDGDIILATIDSDLKPKLGAKLK